jgi:hypothetical protein
MTRPPKQDVPFRRHQTAKAGQPARPTKAPATVYGPDVAAKIAAAKTAAAAKRKRTPPPRQEGQTIMKQPQPISSPSPAEPTPSLTQLVSLSHLALDLDTTAAELSARLADNVLLDDLHRAAIDRDTARALIIEHQDKLAAEATRAHEADAAFRQHLAAIQAPTFARIAAIQAGQAKLREQGLIDGTTPAARREKRRWPTGRAGRRESNSGSRERGARRRRDVPRDPL